MKFGLKYMVLAGVGVAAFLLGYGALAGAWPMGGGGITRNPNYGYFKNLHDTAGTNVWPNSGGVSGCFAAGGNAIPTTVNTATEFINFVKCKLNGGSAQEKVGASFIIQTMIGSSTVNPPSAAQITDWETDVKFAEQMGWISYNVSFAYTINSYYQGTGGGGVDPVDDAFFNDTDSAPSITFKNAAGTIVYAIREECGNPVGNSNFAPIPANPDFNIVAHTTPSVVSPATAAPGSTVHFYHFLHNTGTQSTSPKTINWITQDTQNANASTGSGTWGFIGAGVDQQVRDETFVIPAAASPGLQICRRVGGAPTSPTVGTTVYGAAVCITVGLSSVPGCGGLTVNPATFDPTDSYTVTGVVNVSNGQAGASSVDSASNFFIHITGPGVSVVNDNVTPVTIGGPPTTGTGTLTASITPAATNNAGTYAVSYGIVGPSSPITCSGSFNVAYTPYYAVQGGDVAAGPGFGTACSAKLSDIDGKNLGAANGYYGAGTQLAALSLGNITGFATNTFLSSLAGTGSSSSGASALQPSGLAFSNNGTSPTVWGTTFGKDAADDPADNPTWCVPDYSSAATSASPAPTVLSNVDYVLSQTALNGLTSGKTYVINGNLQITGDGTNLFLGGAGRPSRITLVVNGQVSILSQIKYSSYSYISGTSTVDSIPQFRLIANGSIFVEHGVTTLTGFYVAQGSGNDGNIFTCALGYNYSTNNPGDTAPWYVFDPNYYNNCIPQLTVYGSLAARHVRLNRAGGSWKKTPTVANTPAEQVIYAPELWMGGLMNASSGTQQSYDAITNLPPIL